MFARRRPLRFGLLVIGALVLVCAGSSFAAANSLPKSGAGQSITTISPLDDLVPPSCEALNLQRFISGNGTLTGTSQRDLMAGGSGADTITGLGQRDCILGSGGNDDIDAGAAADVVYGSDGNDYIQGGSGADLLYGGVGNDTIYGGGGGDTLDGGSGTDSCFGEAGTDTFVNCETIVQ